MTLTQVKKKFQEKLGDIYSFRALDNVFISVMKHILNKSATDVRLVQADKYCLSALEKEKLNFILNALADEKPLQYVIGQAEFYHLVLKVNKSVLIPRVETEELVDWVINDIKNNQKKAPTILDIGTGSGCIAIALKKNIPSSRVYATDISKEALKVAEKNAQENNVEIRFRQKDVLSDCENYYRSWDVIVSNPPYITLQERKEMKKNVLEFEPPLALFVEDALIFYRKIATLALESLENNGRLFFEVNQYYAQQIVDLLSQLGYSHIELRKDLFGNPRMIRALL